MATMKQIEAGIAKYIDAELAPKIPVNIPNGQIKKIAAVSGAIYAVRHMLSGGAGVLAGIGAMDKDGDVDVDGMAAVLTEQIPTEGFQVTVPILGPLTFFREDVERLAEYIKEV